MSDELKELREQKRNIEKRIRELTSGEIKAGRVRINVERYPTDKPDRWYISFECQSDSSSWKKGRTVNRSIFNCATKEEAIKEIPAIIQDLQELYEKAINSETGAAKE